MQEIDRSEFCLDVHFIYADQVSEADQNNNLSNSAQCLVICRVNESIQAPNYNLFHNTCAQVWNTVTFIANKGTLSNLAHRQKNVSSQPANSSTIVNFNHPISNSDKNTMSKRSLLILLLTEDTKISMAIHNAMVNAAIRATKYAQITQESTIFCGLAPIMGSVLKCAP